MFEEGRAELALRTIGAFAGVAPGAVLAAIALAKHLPLAEEARFVAGMTLAIPLWVTGMCLVFLTRGALRAWAWCFLPALIFGVFAFGV